MDELHFKSVGPLESVALRRKKVGVTLLRWPYSTVSSFEIGNRGENGGILAPD